MIVGPPVLHHSLVRSPTVKKIRCEVFRFERRLLLPALNLAPNPNNASFQSSLNMIPFSRPPISILFLFSLLILVFAVRSEDVSSAIRLPSEATNNDGDVDLCPLSMPSSCPVKCFRTDPVCGVDGVTYWCGCADAFCSGVKVAKIGFCEVGNGGSASIPGQALLLVHILWLIILGVSVLFGFF